MEGVLFLLLADCTAFITSPDTTLERLAADVRLGLMGMIVKCPLESKERVTGIVTHTHTHTHTLYQHEPTGLTVCRVDSLHPRTSHVKGLPARCCPAQVMEMKYVAGQVTQ